MALVLPQVRRNNCEVPGILEGNVSNIEEVPLDQAFPVLVFKRKEPDKGLQGRRIVHRNTRVLLVHKIEGGETGKNVVMVACSSIHGSVC